MTIIVNVHEAKAHLSRLLEQAHGEQEIILARAGKPYARLMPLAKEPVRRTPGRLAAWPDASTTHSSNRCPPRSWMPGRGASAVASRHARAALVVQQRQASFTHQHAVRAGGYRLEHRDPFDRMLAAQSELEAIALVTNDAAMSPSP
jgi:prevent-host-death family protein